jgi:hypothetical protein
MANLATSSPAVEAWALMQRLFGPQRKRFMALAAEYELSPPQLGALKALHPDHPIAMSELAGILGCDNSNVTYPAHNERRGSPFPSVIRQVAPRASTPR